MIINSLFLYPKPNKAKSRRFGFSLNIAYMSAIMKKYNHNSLIIDISNDDFSDEIVLDKIKENNINIVFVEFDSFALKRDENYQNGYHLINEIRKEYNDVIIVAFGFDCILLKQNIDGADITIKEDPVFALPNVVNRFFEVSMPIIKKLDELPYPDRNGYQENAYFNLNKHSTLVQTSKGCLNKCTFCQRKGWQNRYLTHSVEYVKKEFEYLSNNSYKNIWIHDENFTFNLSRAKSILKMLIDNHLTEGMKIALSSWSKIDFEFLDLAKEANVSIISMGIESANQKSLEFYKKDIDLDYVRDLIAYADSIGIFMVGNFIIGAPNENLEDINKTFEYIKSTKLDQVNIKVLDYMIGSELYENLPKDKYNDTHYFSCKENNLHDIALDDLICLKRDFHQKYSNIRKKGLITKINEYGYPYFKIYNNLSEN